MSQGSHRITLRIRQGLLDQLRAEVARTEESSVRGAEDVSKFIIRAIEERIAHRVRSRCKRQARQQQCDVSWDDVITLVSPHGNAEGSWV
jgi:hypothetical protein